MINNYLYFSYMHIFYNISNISLLSLHITLIYNLFVINKMANMEQL